MHHQVLRALVLIVMSHAHLVVEMLGSISLSVVVGAWWLTGLIGVGRYQVVEEALGDGYA